MSPQQIRQLRERLQMTQDEFAVLLGYQTRSAVCKLEATDPEKRSEPSGPLLKLLERIREDADRRDARRKP